MKRLSDFPDDLPVLNNVLADLEGRIAGLHHRVAHSQQTPGPGLQITGAGIIDGGSGGGGIWTRIGTLVELVNIGDHVGIGVEPTGTGAILDIKAQIANDLHLRLTSLTASNELIDLYEGATKRATWLAGSSSAFTVSDQNGLNRFAINQAEAINLVGATTVNGNIHISPGNVAGNASVVIDAARLDQPSLILKDASGTTTANSFEIRKNDNTVFFKIIGNTDAAFPGTVISKDHISLTASNYSLGSTSNRWLKGWFANLDVSGAVTLGTPLPVGQGGTGTATAFTLGSVVFAGASGTYSQNNANLFWDNTNFRLGIANAAPGVALDVTGRVNATDGYQVPGFQVITSAAALSGITLALANAAPTVGVGSVGYGSTHQTTVGAAGAATALPANPEGYLIINVSGTNKVIPYYANA